MPESAQEPYNQIIAHIREEGSAASNWYAGIASNWESRLEDHNVGIGEGWYIVRGCQSDTTARAVEKALIEYGCDGGGGGGDESTVWVYAYLKTPSTQP